MVATRRSRALAKEVTTESVAHDPVTSTAPSSPRRTRSTRSTGQNETRSTRSTRAHSKPTENELPVTTRKRGRPSKKVKSENNDVASELPRRPLSQRSNDNAAAVVIPCIASPQKSINGVTHTPTRIQSPRKASTTPRIAVYHSPKQELKEQDIEDAAVCLNGHNILDIDSSILHDSPEAEDGFGTPRHIASPASVKTSPIAAQSEEKLETLSLTSQVQPQQDEYHGAALVEQSPSLINTKAVHESDPAQITDVSITQLDGEHMESPEKPPMDSSHGGPAAPEMSASATPEKISVQLHNEEASMTIADAAADAVFAADVCSPGPPSDVSAQPISPRIASPNLPRTTPQAILNQTTVSPVPTPPSEQEAALLPSASLDNASNNEDLEQISSQSLELLPEPSDSICTAPVKLNVEDCIRDASAPVVVPTSQAHSIINIEELALDTEAFIEEVMTHDNAYPVETNLLPQVHQSTPTKQASPMKVNRDLEISQLSPVPKLLMGENVLLSPKLSVCSSPLLAATPVKGAASPRSETMNQRPHSSPHISEALEPIPYLAPSAEQITTPTTTWIDGIEVALPPDEWSPEKTDAMSIDSPSMPDSGGIQSSPLHALAVGLYPLEQSELAAPPLEAIEPSLITPAKELNHAPSSRSPTKSTLLNFPEIDCIPNPSDVEILADDSLVEALELDIQSTKDTTHPAFPLDNLADAALDDIIHDVFVQQDDFVVLDAPSFSEGMAMTFTQELPDESNDESPAAQLYDSIEPAHLHHVDEFEQHSLMESSSHEQDSSSRSSTDDEPLNRPVEVNTQAVNEVVNTVMEDTNGHPQSSSQDELPSVEEILSNITPQSPANNSHDLSFSPVKLDKAVSPAAPEVLPVDASILSPIINHLKRASPEREEEDMGPVKKQKKSTRRQSRRQSYMTATKSAMRERELELQANDAARAAEDLMLVTEFDIGESLLQEMPGSVERRRTRRRTNSTARSPLVRGGGSPVSKKAEPEHIESILQTTSSESEQSLQHYATKIQAVFRGWRERKHIERSRSTVSAVQDATSQAATDIRPPSRAESDINDVFSDFLSKWQSKKSQKAKEEVIIVSPAKLPNTPKREINTSPIKGRITVPVPSSAQKAKTNITRTSRSRLPAPKTTIEPEIKKAAIRAPEPRRAIPILSKLAQSNASPIKRRALDDKRARSTPAPSKAHAVSRPVTPTTPKRLFYLTPAEVTKTTRNFTSQNRLYRCDFDRVVIRKELPRPPSPTAKIQAKMAANARVKRRRLAKDKGYTFGAGDDEDYSPKNITPTRKAVKWEEKLEVDLSTLPKTSPTKVKSIDEIIPCIAPVPLDDFGNLENTGTPLTPEIGKAPTVVITKYLYRGESDDS